MVPTTSVIGEDLRRAGKTAIAQSFKTHHPNAPMKTTPIRLATHTPTRNTRYTQYDQPTRNSRAPTGKQFAPMSSNVETNARATLDQIQGVGNPRRTGGVRRRSTPN